MTLRHALAFAPRMSAGAAAAQPPAGYKPAAAGDHRHPRRAADAARSSVSPTRDRLLLIQGGATRRSPSWRRRCSAWPAPHQPADQRPAPAAARHRPHAPDHRRRQALRPVELPTDGHFGLPLWSPDGKQFAFTNATDGIELWLGDADAADRGAPVEPAPVPERRLRDALQWLPDGRTLLCQTIVADRGQPPGPARADRARSCRRAAASAAPVRTFQDLLQEPARRGAVRLLRHVAARAGRRRRGASRRSASRPSSPTWSPSPDGKYFLVSRDCAGPTRTCTRPRRSRSESRCGTATGRWSTRSPTCRCRQRADRGRADRAAQRPLAADRARDARLGRGPRRRRPEEEGRRTATAC